MTFHVTSYKLKRPGLVRGARGHKKIDIPVGTTVFYIRYAGLYFWSGFLNEQQATKCMDGLEASMDGRARRQLTLENMIAWNFKSDPPFRIAREKEVCT